MKVTVRAPATTANLGPGFDCLGAALNWYVYLEADTETTGWSYEGAAGDEPTDALVRRAIAEVAPEHGGVGLRCRTEVPLGRGFGSSAAALAAGLVAGCVLSGREPDRGELLRLGTPIEGHPDNLAPALFGGIVLVTKGSVRRFEPASAIRPAVVVPQALLSTAEARKALPERVPLPDAVANVGWASALLVALSGAGEPNAADLLECTNDVLHQPYRAPLMRDTADVVAHLRAAGVAAFVSGAGPAVACLLLEETRRAFRSATSFLKDWEPHELEWDLRGAHVA